MTTDTAIANITSKKKWYEGVLKQSYASSFVNRFAQGTLKQKTIERVLRDFGYEGSFNSWKKVK